MATATLTNALRGVFVSSLKLVVFYALFSWLVLRFFAVHFVYLLTTAAAVVAVLPAIPVPVVAVPAILELALLRGQWLNALILALLYFACYWFVNDLILGEIEPSMPYLTGLGIFGGMYAFTNPLQGVLLGPMLLALLSVAYNLHAEIVRREFIARPGTPASLLDRSNGGGALPTAPSLTLVL